MSTYTYEHKYRLAQQFAKLGTALIGGQSASHDAFLDLVFGHDPQSGLSGAAF